jgi:hypothetical protein
MAAYVVYPVLPGLARADVATVALAGEDLAACLARGGPEARAGAWEAVHTLLARLATAGARHPDLNLKNVLIIPRGARPDAYVLDVDRVVFGAAGDPAIYRANARRLLRSARRWRDRHSLPVDDAVLDALDAAASGRSISYTA